MELMESEYDRNIICQNCEEDLAQPNGFCKDCNANHTIRCVECGIELKVCTCGDLASHKQINLCSATCADAYFLGD